MRLSHPSGKLWISKGVIPRSEPGYPQGIRQNPLSQLGVRSLDAIARSQARMSSPQILRRFPQQEVLDVHSQKLAF